MPTSINIPVDPLFGASTNQSSGFPTTYPANSSGSSVFLFGGGSTTTKFSGVLSPSAVSTPENNPFTIAENTVNRRPVIKSKRRVKP